MGWLERINGRWSFGARIALICGLFAAPLALLLFLFVQASTAQIAFSAKELEGSRYLTTVWSARDGGAAPADDGRFNQAEALKAFVAAGPGLPRAAAGADLIAAVADGSNLTLDPDLDSFYVMDAVTVRLPTTLKAVRELEAAYAEGRRDAVVVATEHLVMASAQANASLAAGMKNNASGATRQALEARATAFAAAAEATTRQSQAFLAGASLDPRPLRASPPRSTSLGGPPTSNSTGCSASGSPRSSVSS
ncbi:hypothetical protein LRS10_08825 [Phenylobacterium sp. J426]|uniref:hypothetical protein n=1 Tax=Phenylobacterium sp. J426 TaxID=2898439 RepID=UPI002150D01E|nr:hypothetical protein [Phenylobacterium sp. J426]MCR5874259.1 hypothetical protein [Phenylobacterium sp. J426]